MAIGFEKTKKVTMAIIELHTAAALYIQRETGRVVDPNLIDRVERDDDGSLYAIYFKKEGD